MAYATADDALPGAGDELERRVQARTAELAEANRRLQAEIAELRQAECEQRVQAEKLALMGRLAASFAHEINNPLQAVRSYLELSLDYPVSPAERDHYLRVAREEIERLSEVTRRVLGFYRPASEARTAVCLADLVERTMRLVQQQVQRAGLAVTLDLSGQGRALASGDQLVQVFLNLIINAIEATGQGGRLSITERLEGDQAALDFANDGPAIPDEVMARLFEPFFTTRPDGTGLGLAISRDLVEHYGGSLTAANLPAGVVFTVRLPLAGGEERRDVPRGEV